MNRAQRRKSGNRKPVNFNKAQIDEAKMQAYQQAADFAFKTMICVPVMVMRDNGWGGKRLARFIDKIFDVYDSFSRGYLTLNDMKKTVFEETGINLDEEIEKNARRALERYEADKNYQWLKTCNISTNTKKAVGYQNVMGVVDCLKEAIKKNDLVAMRRHSDPVYDLEIFALCRRKIEEALAEEDKGQMELFDFI